MIRRRMRRVPNKSLQLTFDPPPTLLPRTWLPPRVNGELQPSTVCQKITGPSLRMTSVNTWVSEVAA